MGYKLFRITGILLLFISSCSKKDNPAPTPPAGPFNYAYSSVDALRGNYKYADVSLRPVIRIGFSSPVETASAASKISLKDWSGNNIPVTIGFEKKDSVVLISPANSLAYLSRYTLSVSSELLSAAKKRLNTALNINVLTKLDSSYKFPLVTDKALLDIIQRQHHYLFH